MPEQQKPRRYIVEKHVMASSVQEALQKEPETPVTSVFPAAKPDEESKPHADAIGFKIFPDDRIPYEY